MAFDGVYIHAVRKELQEVLAGARVMKIVQPGNTDLLLTFKTDSSTERLYLSGNPSLPLLYLTDENRPAPLQAPAFTMLLRKHLSGGRLLSVAQPGLERVLDFSFEHTDELGDLRTVHLIAEFMGKHSNLILADDHYVILDAVRRVPPTVSSLRTVLPGKEWFIPDTQGKSDFLSETPEHFLSSLSPLLRLSETVPKAYTGIAPATFSDFLFNLGTDGEQYVSALTKEELEKFTETVFRFRDRILEEAFSPELARKKPDMIPEAYSAFPLSSRRASERYSVSSYESPSLLLSVYYGERVRADSMKQKSAGLRKLAEGHLKRSVRKRDLQLKQLQDTEKREQLKLYGELLSAWVYMLPSGEKSVKVMNYYTNEEVEIPTDPDLSISDNARNYFERYNKQKRTFQALQKLIPETEAEISELMSILSAIDLAEDRETLAEIRAEMEEAGYAKRSSGKKKEKYRSKPWHYRSSDGFDIYVGKNNYQNDFVTFRLAEGNDIFMHAKKAPGSHVIIKTEGREVPDRTYEEAGALAAYYSSLRSSGKAEIDYVERKHVKKPAGAHPGFVIYDTNYSLMAVPGTGGLEKLQ